MAPTQLLMTVHPKHNQDFLVESETQLYDGALVKIAERRRRIFITYGGIRNRPLIWYPETSVSRIEQAILELFNLPSQSHVELRDKDGTMIVLSESLPDDIQLILSTGDRAPAARSEPITRSSLSSVSSSSLSAPVPSTAAPLSPIVTSPTRRSSDVDTQPLRRSPSQGSLVRSESFSSPRSDRGRHSLFSSKTTVAAVVADFPNLLRSSSPSRSGSFVDHSGDMEASLKAAAAADPKCVQTLGGHGGFVLALATAGDVLFSGSQDNRIMIWDLNNLQYIGTLTGHKGFVRCLAASLEKRLLFSGSQDKTIKVWSLEHFECVRTLSGHTDEVYALQLTDRYLISSSEDKTIRIWDLSTLECLHTLANHRAGVFAVRALAAEASPSPLLISGSRDKSIKLWDLRSMQVKRTLHPPHYDCVTAFAVANGKLFSASRDKSIKEWDMHTFQSTRHALNAHSDWICALDVGYTSDRKPVLFSASRDCTVRVWDVETLTHIDTLSGHSASVNAMLTIDQMLFTASNDRTIKVWRWRSD
eukprot:GILK01005665.1.p1 GENE.GILK01005665.1~~GILK01005665.1.p1  ORF type:complete len:589 (-),score=94.47 GILK01005665.1:187-1782(-)